MMREEIINLIKASKTRDAAGLSARDELDAELERVCNGIVGVNRELHGLGIPESELKCGLVDVSADGLFRVLAVRDNYICIDWRSPVGRHYVGWPTTIGFDWFVDLQSAVAAYRYDRIRDAILDCETTIELMEEEIAKRRGLMARLREVMEKDSSNVINL